MNRFAGAALLGTAFLLGALAGCLAALSLALSGPPPAEATVDELLGDPAIRSSIEVEIIDAVDAEIELPLFDEELNTVVDLALSSDAGDEVVRDVVRAAVDQGFEDGPGVVLIELGAFVDELPGPLGLVEGLLDREVEVQLPAAENPLAERIGKWALGTLVALVLTILATASAAGPGRRVGAALRSFGVGLVAAALACFLVPPLVRSAWAQSSDFGQRLLREQLDAVAADLRWFGLFLVIAGVGASIAGRLSNPPGSAV